MEKAAIWSLLGGYLLLPAVISVDVALLPPLDKITVPSLSAFLLCWMRGAEAPRPHRSFAIFLFAGIFVLSPILTTYGNSYELSYAGRSLPGFYLLDGVKLSLQNLISLAPFFIGMRILATDRARAFLLRAMIIATLIYSLPMLFEVRMSPQLQRIIYGAAPSSFGHSYRDGGFRPTVFLSTGLEVAMFTAMALTAAIAALRLRWRAFNLPGGAVVGYLGILLVLCKTLGAILYSVLALPLVLLTKPRTWVRVSFVITLILCAYPMLRNFDIIPVRRVVSQISSFNAERAGSFQFRIENEDRLLAKANQKPAFGWGTWGRNRVFNEDSGEDLTITDGAWILRYGMFGWFGYLGLFGLFAAAIFNARAGVKGPVAAPKIVLGALTLMLAINLIDLVPNANLLPLTFLLAGTIAGRPRLPMAKVRRSTRREPEVTEQVLERVV